MFNKYLTQINQISASKILFIVFIVFLVATAVFLVHDNNQKLAGNELNLSNFTGEKQGNSTCPAPYTNKECFPENSTELYAGSSNTINFSQAEQVCNSMNGTLQKKRRNQSNYTDVYCVM